MFLATSTTHTFSNLLYIKHAGGAVFRVSYETAIETLFTEQYWA